MSTIEVPDHFSSTTTWRARVRFVQDLAPKGMGIFMAPQRSMVLRLADTLYQRTPLLLAVIAVVWSAAALMLWPAVSFWGLALWSALVIAAWGFLLSHWLRSDRPMLRPGASTSWSYEHVSNLWILFLALSSGIVLVFPEGSDTHQQALCLLLVGAGVLSAVFSFTSVRALAAILGPTIGIVAITLILRGYLELAASVSLAGGITVLVALGLYQLAAEGAKRDVETG